MPLSVGHLLLFSPLLPPVQATIPSGDKDEDAHEAAQVAFYSSSDNVGTRDGMLRSLGLAKGLEDFVGTMSFPPEDGGDAGDEIEEGATVITSTSSTMLTLPLEGSFKLHVKFTTSARSATSSLPADPLPPASALKAVVEQACGRFFLLHGPLSALLPLRSPESPEAAEDEHGRRKLLSTVERYWSEWIEHFPSLSPSLMASSHGLALPPRAIAPRDVAAELDEPFALLSHSAITVSPSAQLPTELLHHLLTLVPLPPSQDPAPEAANGAASLAAKDGPPSSWWDGLGSGMPSMSNMTLGLGRGGTKPPSMTNPVPKSEKKSSFPASSLWKKATGDLLSFSSSSAAPPSPARLPPREQDPKPPADVPLPSSEAVSFVFPVDQERSTSAVGVNGEVNELTLKEAMEQALPEPEPIALHWTETSFWLQSESKRDKTTVAFLVLPEQANSERARKLFVYLPSIAASADHPSFPALAAAFGLAEPTPPKDSSRPTGGLPEGLVDHDSFAPSPIKPTISRSPSAVSLLSTLSTPPRPASAAASPVKNVPVSALLRVKDGTACVNGAWKSKGGQGSKRERSVVRNLDLLDGPHVEEIVARTSLSSTWIMARHAAASELVTVVESKGIGLGDVDRFGRQAEKELERQCLGTSDQ